MSPSIPMDRRSLVKGKCKEVFSLSGRLKLIENQCSSGCGVGYSTRNVTCSNGHVENQNECKEPRPVKYKQCENKSHCRWRSGKWKNCTCAGFQKRKISCWDGFKNMLANTCPASDKPISRRTCSTPPNCNYIELE